MVFERLQMHGVLINPVKYMVGVGQLQFMGHQIDRHLPEQMEAVMEFPLKTTTR